MFHDVVGCSGMFYVPGFIDELSVLYSQPRLYSLINPQESKEF